MSAHRPDPQITSDHLDLLDRARRGALTGPEQAALVVLLDRLLIAALLDEEDAEEGRRVPTWHQHVNEAYRALVAVESRSAPPPRVGGADVRPIRRAR